MRAARNTLSDPSIKIGKSYRRFLLDLTMYKRPKSLLGKLKLLKGMKLKDFFAIEKLAIAEYSTRLSMGDNAERLARRLGITRKEQDDYAARSHRLAVAAIKSGIMKKEVVPVVVPQIRQARHK